MTDSLFNPKSIAVIGASREESKVGNVVLKNLIGSGYKSKIIPVNPKADEIMGMKCYASMKDVPENIDLAIITLAAKFVPASVKECAEKGVKYAIAVAGGFSETGAEGKALEEQVREILKSSGMRLIGPNCVGVYFPKSGVNTALTVPERTAFPPAGNISFISQSGAVGLLTMDTICEYGVGISTFVNLGNRMDLSETELVRASVQDKDAKSIILYLESIKDGKEFFNTMKECNAKKPIVLLKAGRTSEGAKAASLHTGSMASNDAIVEGVCRQTGIIRAFDETELVDYGRALAYQKPMKGKNVAIITTAGGLGVLTTDWLASTVNGVGLSIAKLKDETKNKLREALVPFASVENPIDMTAEGSSEQYAKVISILQEDENVDGIIVYALFQTAKVDETLIDALDKYNKAGKPMIVGILGSGYGKKMLIECEKRKIPAYPSVSRTVKAMSALHQRGVYLEGLKSKTAQQRAKPPANSSESREIIKSAPNKFVEEYEVKQILKHYGIKVPDSKVFSDLPKDAKFNFPVVLKVSDPNILHKTDVGGVVLGIKTIEELHEKFDGMKKKFPTSRFIVESMEKSGVEVIIGLMRDPNFGLSIMFGLGGIYTELYKDVTFRTLPISAKDAEEMVSEIKAHRIFEGFRNIKASKEALIDLLLKVSAMGVDLEDQVAQLDLNPVFVRESDAVAVDAKIIKP